MGPTRRTLLRTSSIVLAGGLAGCAGGDGDETTVTTTDGGGTPATGEATTTDGGMTGTATASTPTVQVREHDEYGEILVDDEGMSLYMFDNDTRDAEASSCYDGCASAWPPLTVEGDPTAGGDVTADLTTFERDSGDRQVTANGWPLYYYASDGEPGDTTGQGVGDVWWLLDPSGEPIRPDDSATQSPTATATPATVQVREHDELGDILADGEGMTLYMFDRDTEGEKSSACSGDCASAWPPLTVDGNPSTGSGVTADLATFERESGDRQAAASGWPLYYYASDSAPGDATGQGVGGVWWVLGPSGEPIRPDTATPTATSTPTPTATPDGETTTTSGDDDDDGYY